jgi:hypothetical protein
LLDKNLRVAIKDVKEAVKDLKVKRGSQQLPILSPFIPYANWKI